MRDYDPTTGRYIQADPLGLVDGASVYGYVRQNPGRNVDSRGEFWGIIGGAALGGLSSVVVQVLVNTYYGEMPFHDAWGCINRIPVVTAATFGARGYGVFGQLLKRRYLGAGASLGLSKSLNRSIPKFYLNEPDSECGGGCEIKELPRWLEALKNAALK